MKKYSKCRAAAILMCIILLMVLTAPSTYAERTERYGQSLLTNDFQRLVYQALAEGIGQLATEIVIPLDGSINDSDTLFQDISYAEQMFRKDYPECFWYHGGYNLQSDGTKVVFMPSEYKINGQSVSAGSAELADAQSRVEAVVQQALATIPANPSQYDIALAIHDFVVKTVEYVPDGDHQTAYGALACGKAVCAGYARAYQLLMNRAGISCWYITGQSYSPGGALVGHAWNVVWLDGKCYYSDATWDDQGDELFHEYLNMSLEEIQKTHFSDEPLPGACGHDDYTFFIKNSGKGVCDIRDHKDPAEVAACFTLKSQNGDVAEYYCTLHYHGADFHQWFSENMSVIIEALGLEPGCRYQVVQLGMEHHVTISGYIAQTPPQTESTKPVTQPTEPATQPTEPATQPTELATQPTEPATQPTEPATQPTEPATQPTEPATQPTEPATQPTEPATQPTEPETQPTEPETKPTEPVQTNPSDEPEQTQPDGPQDHPQQTYPSDNDGQQAEDTLPTLDPDVTENQNPTFPSTDQSSQQQKPDSDNPPQDICGILFGAVATAVIVIAVISLKAWKKKHK